MDTHSGITNLFFGSGEELEEWDVVVTVAPS